MRFTCGITSYYQGLDIQNTRCLPAAESQIVAAANGWKFVPKDVTKTLICYLIVIFDLNAGDWYGNDRFWSWQEVLNGTEYLNAHVWYTTVICDKGKYWPQTLTRDGSTGKSILLVYAADIMFKTKRIRIRNHSFSAFWIDLRYYPFAVSLLRSKITVLIGGWILFHEIYLHTFCIQSEWTVFSCDQLSQGSRVWRITSSDNFGCTCDQSLSG